MTPADLRAALATLGLSQARAARLLGVSVDAVELWLAGKRLVSPPADRLLRLMAHSRHGRSVIRSLDRM